jgi:prevent-host-death family protein
MYMMMYIERMPRHYSIAEARSHLSTIVDQAQAGQEIELTRRGKPVAVVVSVSEFARLRAERPRFTDTYERFLAVHVLREVGVDSGYFTASRDLDAGRSIEL